MDDGREPLDGLDEPLVPLNMVGADDLGKQLDDPPPSEAGPVKTPKAPSQSARTVALAQAACARVARKEARIVATIEPPMTRGALLVAYEPHVNFVAAALGVNRAQSATYCNAQIDHLVEHGPEGIEDIARERLLRLALGSDE
jgi:hypothetical protein